MQGNHIGLFGKFHNASSTQTGDYAKPGHYFIILEGVKYGTHAADGKEYVAFNGRYLHILDKALWTGDPKAVPTGKGGQALLNIPGTEPKAGEPYSAVFKDGVLGNENRLKRYVLKAVEMTDADWKRCYPTEADGVRMATIMCDPAIQPLRHVVLEVKSGETPTKSREKIVGSTPMRRVWGEELRVMWEQGKLEPGTVDILGRDKLLETMLGREAAEKQNRQAQYVAANLAGPPTR